MNGYNKNEPYEEAVREGICNVCYKHGDPVYYDKWLSCPSCKRENKKSQQSKSVLLPSVINDINEGFTVEDRLNDLRSQLRRLRAQRQQPLLHQ
jgi:hypothetical protein